ncbi:MAG: hypothetical protein SFV81_27740 [Pirellulaceae bacterium]|nr:hypothetical protein [Pirellulaceae bacterium]
MRYSTIPHPNFLTIAWFLTALLLSGSLLGSLPMVKDSAVCAEERALEVDDDDRSKSFELDLALHHHADTHPTSQTWHELQVFYFAHMLAAIPSANLQRGPPCL